MIDTTCKRRETVNSMHLRKWLKLLPRGMDEPAYWLGVGYMAPRAGPNAMMVPKQPSWQPELWDSHHYRHHLQAV